MILVTVGTHYQSFSRLVQKMDEVAAGTSEEVIIQRGHTKFQPTHAITYDFVDAATYDRLLHQSRILVTHDGAGAMIAGINAGKPVIVVPRLQCYGELLYTNKVELAKKLASMGLLRVVYDVAEIPLVLKNIEQKTSDRKKWVSHKPELIEKLKGYLAQFAAEVGVA